jgi:hypothetical protein
MAKRKPKFKKGQLVVVRSDKEVVRIRGLVDYSPKYGWIYTVEAFAPEWRYIESQLRRVKKRELR